ncbi:MAG: M15 family metallopeptidase [Akkermansia sp.]
MTIDEIRADTSYWQRLLRLGGYYTGKIDGIRGNLQRTAETRWTAEATAAAEQHGTFDTRTETNLATLLPEAQAATRAWFNRAQQHLAARGLDLRIICGTRSYAEQDKLYAKRPRVTNARGGYSMHNFGIAFDIGIFRKGQYLDNIDPRADKEYIALHSACGAPTGMEWGGNFKSITDYPHYQLARWGSGSSRLRAIF